MKNTFTLVALFLAASAASTNAIAQDAARITEARFGTVNGRLGTTATISARSDGQTSPAVHVYVSDKHGVRTNLVMLDRTELARMRRMLDLASTELEAMYNAAVEAAPTVKAKVDLIVRDAALSKCRTSTNLDNTCLAAMARCGVAEGATPESARQCVGAIAPPEAK